MSWVAQQVRVLNWFKPPAAAAAAEPSVVRRARSVSPDVRASALPAASTASGEYMSFAHGGAAVARGPRQPAAAAAAAMAATPQAAAARRAVHGRAATPVAGDDGRADVDDASDDVQATAAAVAGSAGRRRAQAAANSIVPVRASLRAPRRAQSTEPAVTRRSGEEGGGSMVAPGDESRQERKERRLRQREERAARLATLAEDAAASRARVAAGLDSGASTIGAAASTVRVGGRVSFAEDVRDDNRSTHAADAPSPPLSPRAQPLSPVTGASQLHNRSTHDAAAVFAASPTRTRAPRTSLFSTTSSGSGSASGSGSVSGSGSGAPSLPTSAAASPTRVSPTTLGDRYAAAFGPIGAGAPSSASPPASFAVPVQAGAGASSPAARRRTLSPLQSSPSSVSSGGGGASPASASMNMTAAVYSSSPLGGVASLPPPNGGAGGGARGRVLGPADDVTLIAPGFQGAPAKLTPAPRTLAEQKQRERRAAERRISTALGPAVVLDEKARAAAEARRASTIKTNEDRVDMQLAQVFAQYSHWQPPRVDLHMQRSGAGGGAAGERVYVPAAVIGQPGPSSAAASAAAAGSPALGTPAATNFVELLSKRLNEAPTPPALLDTRTH